MFVWSCACTSRVSSSWWRPGRALGWAPRRSAGVPWRWPRWRARRAPPPATAGVGEVSQAAEASGVRRGMALGEALARCPELVLLPADPVRVAERWEAALQALEAIGAAVEPARPGLAYFEADGLRALHGTLAATLAEARGAIVRPRADRGRPDALLCARVRARGPLAPAAGARGRARRPLAGHAAGGAARLPRADRGAAGAAERGWACARSGSSPGSGGRR